MHRITITNSRGESLVLGNSNHILTNIDGVGTPEVDTAMQRGHLQDGRTYLGSTFDARQIALTAILQAKSEEELWKMRQWAMRVLDPKLGEGKLLYEYDGGTKVITVVSEGAQFPPKSKLTGQQNLEVDLICPNPYFNDIEDGGEPLAAWLGGLKFPLRFPTRFAERGRDRMINNDGHVATPVIIEFNGPAVNPVVTNATTGEFIKVRRNLAAGDRLVINTTWGKKSVTIHYADGSTSNGFNYIDPETTFWQLVVGENVIRYTADDGGNQAVLKITWNRRYIGI